MSEPELVKPAFSMTIRKLQKIVSDPIIQDYLRIMELELRAASTKAMAEWMQKGCKSCYAQAVAYREMLGERER